MSVKNSSPLIISSKLIQLLGTLSKKEMRALSLFLASPYFNTNPELVRFFELIRNAYPSFKKLKGGKEVIFQQLYPKESFDDKRVRYLMSDLLKLAEQFLLVQRIERKPVESGLHLLDELNQRGLSKHYQQQRNKVVSSFPGNDMIDLDHFAVKLRLSDIDQEFFHLKRQRHIGDDPQEASDNLNRYFVLKKLKYACSMLNRQEVFSQNYDLGLPEDWSNWLANNDFWGEEIIRVYAYVYRAFRFQKEPIHFQQLKDWLLQNSTGASLRDLKDLHLYAINYCARKIRQGRHEYSDEALSLYLNGIKFGALLEDGYFSPWSFGNVVKLALRLEKYGWIEQFMQDHEHYLPPGFRENTMLYNYAELYVYKREHSKALNLLVRVEFSDLSYHLGSRIMLAKIYYELDEENALLSLMDSFVKFLKRNKKVSENIRRTCLNFCDLLQAITRGRTVGIEEKIRTLPLLTDREWLLEKLANV